MDFDVFILCLCVYAGTRRRRIAERIPWASLSSRTTTEANLPRSANKTVIKRRHLRDSATLCLTEIHIR